MSIDFLVFNQFPLIVHISINMHELWKMYMIDIVNGKWSYSDLQKHESSCLLSGCFSCISPETLEQQKSFLRLFESMSEELSDVKRIF